MKISPMIRFGSPDTQGPNRKDKVFYIVFDTEEEAQEIINLLEVLRIESREKAKKTPDEWEKMGFKITIKDEMPTIEPTAFIAGILKVEGKNWFDEEMKKMNLPYGQYWAFEWKKSTILFYDSNNPA